MTLVTMGKRTQFLVDLLHRIARRQALERTSLSAAGAAFWIVLSIFPAMITVVSVFGLVVDPNEVAAALAELTDYSPGDAGGTLVAQLQTVANAERSTLTASLVISVLVSLWSASAAAFGLSRAIAQSYRLPPRNYVSARWRAFLAGIVGVLAIALAAYVVTAAARLDDAIHEEVVRVAVATIEFAATFLALVLLMLAVYRFAIGRHTSVRAMLPGAILSTVGIAILVAGFDVYLRYFNKFNAIYGAAAGIAIALIVGYLSMYIVLLGAILNSELSSAMPDQSDDMTRTTP